MNEHIAEPIRHLAIPITSVVLDPSNARKHGDRNIEAIKASLAKFGQRAPIVVQRDGMVVRSGNGRLLAAKALGWAEIAATIIDEDNATAAQFAIADNRTAELAEWDEESLKFHIDCFPDLQQFFAADQPIEEEDASQVFDVKQAGTIWLVVLMADESEARAVKADLEQRGCKVSIGVHRQQ